MAVDQIDRAITARRLPPPVNQVGRGVRRVTRRSSALIRRIVVLAVALIRSIAAATPRVLRSVIGAATGLISRVADLGLRIAHVATGSLRRAIARTHRTDSAAIAATLDDGPTHTTSPGSTPPAGNPKEPAMTDEHVKGAITDVKGKVEETAGKVTGNKEQELHGKAKQVQGEAQKTLGDVQDAVRGDKK